VGIEKGGRDARRNQDNGNRKRRKEKKMSNVQESNKNFGFMCCGPWAHRSHPASGYKFGILLITIGLIWLGAAVGWIDLSWLRSVPFWPTAFILFGVWLVFKGSTGGKKKAISTEKGKEV
jgi:hypothetical protein